MFLVYCNPRTPALIRTATPIGSFKVRRGRCASLLQTPLKTAETCFAILLTRRTLLVQIMNGFQKDSETIPEFLMQGITYHKLEELGAPDYGTVEIS